MLFPFADDNPTHIRPYLTWFLIVANCVIYLWQTSLPPQALQEAIFSLGFVPQRFFGVAGGDGMVSGSVSLFTSMFMHGGWAHLLGNMLYLWIFGDNIEAALGRIRFIFFYLVGGVAAALAQGLTDPASPIPMVGASGAISAVLGAYLLIFPRATVRCLLFLWVYIRILHIPAMYVLGFWFLIQLISGAATLGSNEGGVAFWAHAGGFVAGMILIIPLRRKGVSLFQQSRHRAFARYPVQRRDSWGRVPPSQNTPDRPPRRRGPWG